MSTNPNAQPQANAVYLQPRYTIREPGMTYWSQARTLPQAKRYLREAHRAGLTRAVIIDNRAEGAAPWPAHTPGPRFAGKPLHILEGRPDAYWQVYIYADGGNRTVALAYGHSREEAEANARLMVAEPELLHHLRILAEEDSQCASDWVDKKQAARTAIAKAEGWQ